MKYWLLLIKKFHSKKTKSKKICQVCPTHEGDKIKVQVDSYEPKKFGIAIGVTNFYTLAKCFLSPIRFLT